MQNVCADSLNNRSNGKSANFLHQNINKKSIWTRRGLTTTLFIQNINDAYVYPYMAQVYIWPKHFHARKGRIAKYTCASCLFRRAKNIVFFFVCFWYFFFFLILYKCIISNDHRTIAVDRRDVHLIFFPSQVCFFFVRFLLSVVNISVAGI